jgi:hypothetical protein
MQRTGFRSAWRLTSFKRASVLNRSRKPAHAGLFSRTSSRVAAGPIASSSRSSNHSSAALIERATAARPTCHRQRRAATFAGSSTRDSWHRADVGGASATTRALTCVRRSPPPLLRAAMTPLERREASVREPEGFAPNVPLNIRLTLSDALQSVTRGCRSRGAGVSRADSSAPRPQNDAGDQRRPEPPMREPPTPWASPTRRSARWTGFPLARTRECLGGLHPPMIDSHWLRHSCHVLQSAYCGRPLGR